MMEPSDWVLHAVKEHRGGAALSLMLDFDGTLAPIVSHPRLSKLPTTTRASLSELASTDRVSVGILSGRPLEELKAIVGIPGIAYAGSSGMQIDLGDIQLSDPLVAEFDEHADAIAASFLESLRRFPTSWVEKKPGCLSVHHRYLTPLMGVCLQEEIRETIANSLQLPAIRIRDVTRALEITMVEAWTKADALARILARSTTAYCVFAGDGANDEEAVSYVNSLDGMTIGIGPDAPASVQARTSSSEAFSQDLDRLLYELAYASSGRERGLSSRELSVRFAG